jgi:AraC family transcriptional regulator, regulatory protein of adaptative response / methylated-DNA-[protein]-cysteine methyltransferase
MTSEIIPNMSRDKTPNDDLQWRAVLERDASHDGAFVFAVTSTGVYCRPSCPSRRAHRKNVLFFARPDEAERAGFRACLRCRPLDRPARERRAGQLAEICAYIQQHLEEPLRLRDLGRRFNMSPFYLQRVFTEAFGVSPREYHEAERMKTVKRQLQAGSSVTDATYAAGFGSSSRLYEKSQKQLGMSPAAYRRRGEGTVLGYITLKSPVGRMLVAATDKGICSIQFGDTDSELIERLRAEFPKAEVQRKTAVLQRWVDALLKVMYGEQRKYDLPLDVEATAFQMRVWKHLQSIPYGQKRSYAQVAAEIGSPAAARAVARACASNHVAVAIPCHRVVRGNGDLGGYRWGTERKRKLLSLEAVRKSTASAR